MESQLASVLEILDTLDTPEERRDIILALPKELKNLLILHYGQLTPKPSVSANADRYTSFPTIN